MRIGERRAVAVKIGQHMQPPGKVETLFGAQRHDALGDLAVAGSTRLAARAMQADDVVEQRAGGRLSAFADPAVGKRCAKVRAPSAGKGPLFGRHRHDAARRSRDQGKVPVQPGPVCGEAAEHAERAGIGVDDAGRDAAILGQAEIVRGLLRERAEVGADRAGALGQASALQHVGQPDRLEEIAPPAGLFMREIGPFAGQRALRAGKRAGRPISQEIGQVEKIAGFVPALRQVALQPHQLRRSHFRRHDAAEIVEHTMARRRAFVGFGKRAMVEPDDGVPALFAGHRDAELAAVAVANDQRAGGIEADAGDAFRRDAGLLPRGADRYADRRPDVFRIVLGVVGLRLMHEDRVFGAAKHVAGAVENAGARAPRPDIDGADISLHHDARLPLSASRSGSEAHVGENPVRAGASQARPPVLHCRHANRR